jgi:hypothetical protein
MLNGQNFQSNTLYHMNVDSGNTKISSNVVVFNGGMRDRSPEILDKLDALVFVVPELESIDSCTPSINLWMRTGKTKNRKTPIGVAILIQTKEPESTDQLMKPRKVQKQTDFSFALEKTYPEAFVCYLSELSLPEMLVHLFSQSEYHQKQASLLQIEQQQEVMRKRLKKLPWRKIVCGVGICAAILVIFIFLLVTFLAGSGSRAYSGIR